MTVHSSGCLAVPLSSPGRLCSGRIRFIVKSIDMIVLILKCGAIKKGGGGEVMNLYQFGLISIDLTAKFIRKTQQATNGWSGGRSAEMS